MINDGINDDRKLTKRKLQSILHCNMRYEGQTFMISFVKKNSKSKFSRVDSSKSKIISFLYDRYAPIFNTNIKHQSNLQYCLYKLM